jgi:hypothetical protein
LSRLRKREKNIFIVKKEVVYDFYIKLADNILFDLKYLNIKVGFFGGRDWGPLFRGPLGGPAVSAKGGLKEALGRG